MEEKRTVHAREEKNKNIIAGNVNKDHESSFYPLGDFCGMRTAFVSLLLSMGRHLDQNERRDGHLYW